MSDVSGVDSAPLDLSDDLFDVQSELTPVVAKWRSIGLALRLKADTLDSIHTKNNGDPTACLISMATEWLRRNYDVGKFGQPTWQMLVKAVGSRAGGANNAHAEKIAKSHKAGAVQSSPDITHFSEVDSTPLESDDLPDVQDELTPAAAKWKSIGIALRLNPDTLESIQAEKSGDLAACLESMVTDWLEKNYNWGKFGEPTWQMLAKAVGHPAGGAYMALAEKIAETHKAGAPVSTTEVCSAQPGTKPHVDEYAGLRYEPKMADLMNEIAVKLPDKWKDIGRGLGLEEYELKQIKVQEQSTSDLFSAVFNKWYTGKKSPYTWEQVLKVLYQPAVGGDRVADELKKKYRVP